VVDAGIHWLENMHYVEIIGKVVRKTFVVTVKVNFLAYVETTTPKYKVFSVLTR
jgi:hypothetical protein